MKRLSQVATLVAATLTLAGCGGSDSNANHNQPAPDPTPPLVITDHSGLTALDGQTLDDREWLSGGDATVLIANQDAFSKRPIPIANDFQLDGFFTAGDHIFRTPHTDAGPLLSNDNCQGCHIHDGKGKVPNDINNPMMSMLIKIAQADGSPDPIYGSQIQPFAIQSFTTSDASSGLAQYNGSLNGDQLFGEAFPFVEYELVTGQYPDGQTYQLQRPIYKIRDLSFGDFNTTVKLSARVAPGVFGSGLLEAIPAANIEKLAQIQTTNPHGVSGKVSQTTDVLTGEPRIGRFSYKAQSPSVLQQASAAYRGDIGITNKLFNQEPCTSQQLACLLAAEQEEQIGTNTDFSDHQLALVEFYNRTLAVPARRGYDQHSKTWDDTILAGRKLFYDIACVDCHVARHVTGMAAGSVLGGLTLTGLTTQAEPIEVLSQQVIFPYTDLLLHDMGGSCQINREDQHGMTCTTGPECLYVQRCDGLADDLPEGNANGREWKTPALWGVGLVQTVNPQAGFLHDGRARSLEEAILWHGGEASHSQQAFMQLSARQRQQLLDFVGSL